MWIRDEAPHILNQDPGVEYGWNLVDGAYAPIWFKGPQLPDTLVPDDMIQYKENEESDLEMAGTSD